MMMVCASCGKSDSLKKCTGCRSVWYCSKECQLAHRGAHKKECAKQQSDAYRQLKAQNWQKWFDEPVPAVDNMTPTEASKSARGRMLLDELFALYDNFGSDMGSFNVNVPTRYARWKLGYGPGSAAEFSEEEAIMNWTHPGRRTTRTERHTMKLENKKICMFVPERCEHAGCEKRGRGNVTGCSKCLCVFYCCKDHQVKDWPRHKLDCKVLRKNGIEGKPFQRSEELKKYPLGCFPLATSSKKEKCFICHSSSDEVDITYTECCNLPVCDNQHEYQTMSYSRNFCGRSHWNYTNCLDHRENGHEGDWRECAECNMPHHGARPFRSTNRFCITPCLERFLPQGSMFTYECDRVGCPNRILPGYSATSTTREGTTVCSECAAPILS